jgi:C-terminal processing protease CtpA/Prc
LADTSAEEFKVALRLLSAALADGHVVVGLGSQIYELKGLAVALRLIDSQVVVVTAAQESRQHPGDVILSIDGRPAVELLAEEERPVSGSPQWKRHQALEALILGEPGSLIRLVIQRDDKKLTLQAKRDFTGPIRSFVHEDGIWYVDLSFASWKQIEEQLELIAAATSSWKQLSSSSG